MKTKPLKTIDELCGVPNGTFKKFVEDEKKRLLDIENERKERIRRHRKS